MTARGGSPLDLAALEKRLDDVTSRGGTYTYLQSYQAMEDIRALLALLRETRAALYPYVAASQPSSPLLDRALAALAQAVEGG